MCGISLLINKTNVPLNEALLKAMNTAVYHRGPDDEGIYTDKSMGLGQRRLSILDLSKDGHQPMMFQDKYAITYNGEIYNYIEVRESLQQKGYKFYTRTDTEVILAAYDCWGYSCLNYFNGMWAFCIYDKTKNEIFISRDRFGVKPLYYLNHNNIFAAGSEIKQLLPFLEKKTINLSVAMNFIVLGFVEFSNETFFKNIQSLPASHYMVYNLQNHRYEIKRYYTLKKIDSIASLSEEECISLYQEKIISSIDIRLRSDVRVGTCLSGGLDSSFISSIASSFYRKGTTEKFTGITAKSIDTNNDESSWARRVAEYADLDWQTIQPGTNDFMNALDKVILCQEEPFGTPSVYMQYFVMQKAKELNCTVMLDGQGGDETLLGYERYYAAYLSGLPLTQIPSALSSISKHSKLNLKQLLLFRMYFGNSYIRKKRMQLRSNFIKSDYIEQVDWNYIDELAEVSSNISDFQVLELTKTCLPHLLKYEDKNSMHHSIETRLPFLDYRAVETALSIPVKYKIKDGWSKYILRMGAENKLPADIRWRTNKYGFESPDNVWLKSPYFKEQIEDSEFIQTIIKAVPEKLGNEQLWRLFNVGRWEKMFNVTQ